MHNITKIRQLTQTGRHFNLIYYQVFNTNSCNGVLCLPKSQYHIEELSGVEWRGRQFNINTLQHSVIQCSEVQCSAVQCSSVQCSAVQ